MKFDDKTPRQMITIQDETYQLPVPFIAGHVCTANEAAALNQLLTENTRNNFAARVRQAKSVEGGPLPSQADFDAYVIDYEFGIRGGNIKDPLEREARAIAKTLLEEKLRKQGKKTSAIDSETWQELINGAMEKHGDELRKRAAPILAARKKAGSAELDF